MNIEIGTTIYTIFSFLVLIFLGYMIGFFIRSVKNRQEQLKRIEEKLDRADFLREKKEKR